jgi:hypothetical protein
MNPKVAAKRRRSKSPMGRRIVDITGTREERGTSYCAFIRDLIECSFLRLDK